MSLGLKVTFLGATAFPMATYGCEAWAMTNLLIRSVLMHSNRGVIEYCSGCHGWKGKSIHGCWTIILGLF